MDRIWSPWRAKYVTESVQKDSNFVFLRMAEEDKDEENLILWRGTHVFIVLNLFPYNNGHLLIVPYRKVEHYIDLSAEEQCEIASALDRSIRWLDKALKPEGYNIGLNLGIAGGAGIPKHLHVHVVPRWSADTNFMSSTAQTRVIPEALHDTYRRIRTAISAEE